MSVRTAPIQENVLEPFEAVDLPAQVAVLEAEPEIWTEVPCSTDSALNISAHPPHDSAPAAARPVESTISDSRSIVEMLGSSLSAMGRHTLTTVEGTAVGVGVPIIAGLVCRMMNIPVLDGLEIPSVVVGAAIGTAGGIIRSILTDGRG